MKLKAGIRKLSSVPIASPKASLRRRLLASLARTRLFRLKFRGLRISRIREWRAVLRDNEAAPGWRGWLAMIRLAFRSTESPAVSDYWKCIRCPYHDRAFKRCGDGSGIIGCGCFTVYAIAAGKPCWGRENLPDFQSGY